MDKKLVFIASGGRTGTEFLGHCLGHAIEDCWSEHESDVFSGIFPARSLKRIREHGLWHMVIGRALGRTGVRAAGMRYLSGQSRLSEIAAQLRRERDSIYDRRPESLVIDSFPRWWMFAGVIDRIWPSAKTIMIIRDPKDWIASWLAHMPKTARSWTNLFPPGSFIPTTVGDTLWADRWRELSPVGRLAWEWREIYRRIANAAEGRDCRLFRFEELFGATTGAMQELVDFARHHGDRIFAQREFDLLRQAPRNVRAARSDTWQGWSVDDRVLVNELCGPLMRKFDYDLLPTVA